MDAIANVLTAGHDIINLDENGGIATSVGPQRYETMDTETFEALAQTVDMLLSTDATQSNDETKEQALDVANILIDDGVSRLAGSMQTGVPGEN